MGEASHMLRSDSSIFRVFGYSRIFSAVPLRVLFLAKLRSRVYYHGPSYSFLGWMALYVAVVGFGLLHLKEVGGCAARSSHLGSRSLSHHRVDGEGSASVELA
jgi:hypothetical protein